MRVVFHAQLDREHAPNMTKHQIMTGLIFEVVDAKTGIIETMSHGKLMGFGGAIRSLRTYHKDVGLALSKEALETDEFAFLVRTAKELLHHVGPAFLQILGENGAEATK